MLIAVRVLVKKSNFQELEFDVIDQDGYVKTFELDHYQIRQYRATEREVIQAVIEEHYRDLIPHGQDYRLNLFFI